ncbi:MAG: T9SS type A sorting domain-containing protein [Flavobacteriales bacterium]|nr:T9SS type A sorting domain-containing protein [Flavobacteriales bacterium]MCB9173043.1 T9SS type A sorting domain-containing protein [Flavobacteriales bacterium]
MKKIVVIFLLICSTSSFAQTYFPFPDSVGVWKQTSIYDQMSTYGFTHYNIFLKGDTNINGNSYKKLYTYSCGQFILPSTTQTPIFNCPIDTLNSLYYGALREVNKKILFFPDSLYNYTRNYNFCFTINSSPTSFDEELLLYDFNISIGDTVVYETLDSLKMIITSIDSIIIQSDFRKRYNYNLISNWSSSCNPFGTGLNYVEGIGDINSGLFSLFMFYFENAEYINCFEDNEVTFSNNGGCVTNSLNENVQKNKLKIYPNPSSDKFFIELENPTPTSIRLFDINGKEIYSTTINQVTSTIDVSSFKRGLYLVKLIDEKGTTKSQLISIY